MPSGVNDVLERWSIGRSMGLFWSPWCERSHACSYPDREKSTVTCGDLSPSNTQRQFDPASHLQNDAIRTFAGRSSVLRVLVASPDASRQILRER